MSRPIRAEIHPAALRHNIGVARRHGGQVGLWAVVKAHGYGHGLLRVAQALNGLTDGYALLELEEAEALRREGFTQPILLLEGFFSPEELPRIATLGLVPVIHSLRQLLWLEQARLSRPIEVYLKLNTGMNRLGFKPADLPALMARLTALPQVAGVTLMSHFADADGPSGIAGQLARFQQAAASVPGDRHRSLANSATLLRFPEAVGGQGDWARPGILLYGASPMPERHSALELGLQPAMTLSSELIAVQDLQTGDRIGYGGGFQAERAMRVGVVACGYADGYPRHAPTGTPIAVAGHRTRTLGRVSMDMLVADISDIPEADVGSEVVLWGRQGGAYVAADEVAAAAGTIAYELFCALAPRVPVLG